MSEGSLRKLAGLGLLLGATLGLAVSASLFVPPVRNKVFSTKLWPWRTPFDTTEAELKYLRSIARPGDIVVESNLHGWQWMLLSKFMTGSSWVHAALVDENLELLTVHQVARKADWDIYLEWGSTSIALLRPPYSSEDCVTTAIEFARSKIGTAYDPSFRDHAGNCNGLVGSALAAGGVQVATKDCFGRSLYAPDCFFSIPEVDVVYFRGYDFKSAGKANRIKEMLLGLLVLLSVFSVGITTSAWAAEQNGPVVVELFTSEGCSSCPPADALLTDLIKKYPKDVAALSEHVDYWNYLGWKDPYSQPIFTHRQNFYAGKFRLGSVYTPQMVVNGMSQTSGNQAANVYNLIESARAIPLPSLPVSAALVQGHRRVVVSIELNQRSFRNANLNIAVTEDDATSSVRAGENRGRKLHHSAVTRLFVTKLAPEIKGSKYRYEFDLPRDWNFENLNVIVFLQKASGGSMVASGKCRIN